MEALRIVARDMSKNQIMVVLYIKLRNLNLVPMVNRVLTLSSLYFRNIYLKEHDGE